MVIKQLIDELMKVPNIYTEVFISINGEDGINIDKVVDEKHAIFLEINIGENLNDSI